MTTMTFAWILGRRPYVNDRMWGFDRLLPVSVSRFRGNHFWVSVRSANDCYGENIGLEAGPPPHSAPSHSARAARSPHSSGLTEPP